MKILAPVILCSFLSYVSNAFTINSCRLHATMHDTTKVKNMRSTQRSRGSSTHYLSTTEMDDGAKRSLHIDQTSDLSNEEGWQEYLQTREVQEVRQQLIDKYLSLGRTQEYAEVEIDRFLNDPSRSQKFLEMRKYVKSQEDASMGFENFLLYGCAFIFGLLGDAIFKHLLSFQEMSSDTHDLFHFM